MLTSAATENDPLVAISEIAHIVADKPDGPRGDSPLSAAERNRYENLILLCNVHHELIDAQPATYRVEDLLDMKHQHEIWVEQRLGGRDVARPETRSHRVIAVEAKTLPTVSAVSDPTLLGIHAAIPLAEPIGDLDHQLPTYIRRDIDEQLRKAIREDLRQRGFMLLVGRAACGKTRTAYEAVKAELPDWRIFIPSDVAEVNGLAAANRGDGRIVVWLDELQPYLEDANLSLRAFRGLISDHAKPVIIVGTLWPQQYDALSTQPVSGQADPFQTARRVVRLARRWDLASTFSAAELSRMSMVSQVDPRIDEAEHYSAAYGSPTTVLACAPELVSRFTNAGNAIGRALVKAAAHARLAGHSRVMPVELLERLAAQQLSPEDKATVRPEWFTDALGWARQPVRGVVPLMKPYARTIGTPDGYELSDIIASHVFWHSGFRPHDLPVGMWEALATTSDLNSCLIVGFNALQVGHVQIGRQALTRCANASIEPASIALGLSYLDAGELDDALQWFTSSYDNGEAEAAGLIALVHSRLGNVEQAKHWLEVSAATNEPVAQLGLGQIHEDAGELDLAYDCFQRAAEQGFVPAYTSLGNLHTKRGEHEAAEPWWKRAAAGGEPFAMMNLAQHDLDRGKTLGAERWWRAAAELNVVEAAAMLAEALFEREQHDEAMLWARRAAEAMYLPAWGLLGHHLAEQGEIEEGKSWLARGAEAGQINAMAWYAELLEDLGDLEGAERWMAKLATEHDLPAAQARYGIFLHLQGQSEAALTWIRLAMQSGDESARMLLATAAQADTVLSDIVFDELEDQAVPPHVVSFPAQIQWTPIEQGCGCVIDWGWDRRSDPEAFMTWCVEMTLANCVWHRADSDRFQPPPDGATIALGHGASGVSYFVRQATGTDIELGQELTRQLRELMTSSRQQLMSTMPGQMRRYFENEGYDPAELWRRTRLTDIVLNRGGSMDWHGISAALDGHGDETEPGTAPSGNP